MILSPFTPIFFPDVKSDGLESRCLQTFASTDCILIEYFGEQKPIILKDANSGRDIATLDQRSWSLNGSMMYFAELKGLSNGVYSLTVGDKDSYPFMVTDDKELLEDTILLQYSMKDNRQRTDGVFLIDGVRHFFDFRVPGGFKASDIQFGLDNEQFTTPLGDICELYALDSVQRVLTMGDQEGVPVRFAEMLNRLLTCTYVYVDGERYERKESSVPEMNVLIEGLDSFVFKVTLQRVMHISPDIEAYNLAAIRRADESHFRLANDTINRIII